MSQQGNVEYVFGSAGTRAAPSWLLKNSRNGWAEALKSPIAKETHEGGYSDPIIDQRPPQRLWATLHVSAWMTQRT
jgi:hypothetical protein